MLEEGDELSFKHTKSVVPVHLNVWVWNHGAVFVLETRIWGHVIQVVFKDRSLDEVTQVACGGEQRLF